MKYNKLHIIIFLLLCYLFVTCSKEDYFSGKLITKVQSNVDTTNAEIEGKLVIENGNGVKFSIIENGVLFSTNKSFIEIMREKEYFKQDYYRKDSSCISSTTEIYFNCDLTNLKPNTHYFACAYSILHCKYSNQKNIKYENIIWGNIEEFKTKEVINDIDTTNKPIVLEIPKNVVAKLMHWGDYRHILIEWDIVQNAISYEIWRSSTGADNSFSSIGSVNHSVISEKYEDWQPLIGNNYYKVRAINGIYKSDFSEIVYCNFSSTNYAPCPPNNLAVNGNTTSMTLTWGYTTSSDCGTPTLYKIYKRNHYTGSYDLVDSTANYTYTQNAPNITPGFNLYAVRSKNNYGESNPIYEMSSEIPLSTPTNFTAIKNGTNVTFSWNTISQATGYKIFMCSNVSGTYIEQFVIEENTNSYVANFPYAAGTIYFKVKANYNPPYALPYGGIVSEFSNYISVSF